MNIIPKPNGDLIRAEGFYTLHRTLAVDLGPFEEYCVRAFERRAGVCLEPRASNPSLVLQQDIDYGPEQYCLEVMPERVSITAATERGVIWALTTLYLNMEKSRIPCITLTDAPRYGHRSLMLDVSRHFYGVSQVKQIIEQLSLAKINRLHWHLTDDQGWRIESHVFPELIQNQHYYTQKEIKGVVAYAKERGVDVIPEIDMPGHISSLLAVKPELSCAGTAPVIPDSGGIFPVILCPGKEATFDFIEALLDEVLPLFDSPYFHIGGDEAPKSEWKKCPHCNARMEQLGLTDYEDLQGYFTCRVAEYLAGKGKTAVCWNDSLKASLRPDNLVIQYWIEMGGPSPTVDFFNEGGRVYFSDMLHYYFDYPHGMIPLKKAYEYDPQLYGESCAGKENTMGVEACVWAERIRTEQRQEELIFPRVYAVAETGWSRDKDYADFERRLEPMLSQLDRAGISYTSLENANPTGEVRRREVMELLKGLMTVLPAEGEGESPIPPEMIEYFMQSFVDPEDMPYIKEAMGM